MHESDRPVDLPPSASAWELAGRPVPPVPFPSAIASANPSGGGAAFAGRTPNRASAIRAGIVLGSALVVVIGSAVVMGASPTSPSPAPNGGAQPSAAPSTPGDHAGTGNGPSGGRGPFNGFGPFGGLGPFGALLPFPFGTGPSTVPGIGPLLKGDGAGGIGFGGVTVTAVSGNDVSLATDDGWTRTITVTADTKITKGGEPATIDQVKAGDVVRFSERRNNDGTWTITALAVVLPQTAGTVTAVGPDTITITGRDGASQTVHTNDKTAYHRDGSPGTRADVTVGSTIVAAGERGADGSLTATSVTVVLPRVAGTVSAVNGDTITITGRDGTTTTVHVGSGTSIAVAGVPSPTVSDIKKGMAIVVAGTRRADGSLDATAIGAGEPGKIHDRLGPVPKSVPNASPAPSSTTG